MFKKLSKRLSGKTGSSGFNLHDGMSQQNIIYTGRLYRYKGNKRWKQAWLVIDTDCTVFWFNDKHCTSFKGLANVRELLGNIEVAEGAISRYGESAPDPPYDHNPLFIAIPTKRAKGSNPKLTWFCAKTSRELGDWLEALAKALGREGNFKVFRSKLPDSTSRMDSGTSAGSVSDEIDPNPGRIGEAIARRPSLRFGWGGVWDQLRTAVADPAAGDPGSAYENIPKPEDPSQLPNGDVGTGDISAILAAVSEENEISDGSEPDSRFPPEQPPPENKDDRHEPAKEAPNKNVAAESFNVQHESFQQTSAKPMKRSGAMDSNEFPPTLISYTSQEIWEENVAEEFGQNQSSGQSFEALKTIVVEQDDAQQVIEFECRRRDASFVLEKKDSYASGDSSVVY